MKPMLAEEADLTKLSVYLEDDKYFIEQKLDGHRVLLAYKEERLTVLNRHGKVSQHHQALQHPDFLCNFLQFKNGAVVLDAELVGATAYVFDLPHMSEHIDPSRTLSERREMLEKIFEIGEFSPRVQLVPCAKTTQEKIGAVQACVDQRAEGVMIKDRTARYTYHRSSAYLKLKFTNTADFVVLETRLDGKENASLGVYTEHGDLIEVGRCSLLGKGDVEAGDVVEVRYLYYSLDHRLLQPVLLRVRQDKDPTECVASQLHPIGKVVVQ